MTYLFTEIPEYYKTVSDPVCRQVIRSLAPMVGFDPEQRIYMAGHLEAIALANSDLDNSPRDLSGNNPEGITIQLEEITHEDTLFTTAFHQDEHKPIFEDPALKIRIQPVYKRTKATVNFTARFMSKTQALRWRDSLSHRMHTGQRELFHEVGYLYLIPMTQLGLLHHLYTLRERRAGYGQSWKEYTKAHFTPRARKVTTLDEKTVAIGINERQSQIVGWWDFELEPEVEQNSEAGGKWALTFTYAYEYDRISGLFMNYPLMVHNQIVDDTFIPYHRIITDERDGHYTSKSRYLLDHFNHQYENRATLAGVRIPEWDDWIPNRLYPFTASVFVAMVAFEEDDLTYVCQLTELGDFTLDPRWITYLCRNPSQLFTFGASPLLLQVYCEGEPLNSDLFTIDLNLVVRAKEPLDIRKPYHVRLAVVTDLTKLTLKARQRLIEHGDIAKFLLETLYPGLEADGLMPPLLGGKYMPERKFLAAAEHINGVYGRQPGHYEPHARTVNFFTIGVTPHGYRESKTA